MRTPAEHLGNQRLTRLLHDADARGLARSGIGGTTGTPLPAELAARMAAVAGARASRVNFSYSVRVSSRLDSDDLLIEFIKQYREAGTNEEARRIRDQEDWKWTGTAPTVTDAHIRQGYILIPVTDRSITPATADERRQRREFLTGLSPADQETIDALSPGVRAVLGEDNLRAIPQDDYPALMRIAGKLAELSPAELAEYRGRVTASTTGWEELEASVDRFIAERHERQAATQERERTVTQLYGMRELYRRYRLYLSMLTNTAALAAPVGGMGGAGLGTALGSRPTINRLRSELEADLAPYGGMAGFEALIRRYEKAYEHETLAVARVMLDQYEHTLYEQGQRYQSAAAGTELHRAVALTGARQHYEEAEREARTSMMYGGSMHESPTMDDLALEHASRSATAHQRGEAAVGGISGTHPLATNADFDRERLARAEPGEAGSMMREYIAARRRDIGRTRRSLADRPTLIYQLDALMTASYQSQRIAPDSVYDLIIRDHARDVAIDEAIPDIVLAVVAIAAGLLSGGTGTVAVAAAGTALGTGAYQAVEEFRRYETRSAAHGAQLLSDCPSFAWVVVALIGVGLDAAAVASLLRSGSATRRAVEIFNENNDMAAFRRQLLSDAVLEERIRLAATRAAEAEAEARAAWRSVLKPTQGVLYAVPIPGTVEFGKLVYAVYLSIRRGIREFELFLHTRQAAELGLGAARFAAPEMARDLATLKNSYLRAIADLDAVRAQARALGLSEQETNAFLRMWGECPTPMTAEEVGQEMGAWTTALTDRVDEAAQELGPAPRAGAGPHLGPEPAATEPPAPGVAGAAPRPRPGPAARWQSREQLEQAALKDPEAGLDRAWYENASDAQLRAREARDPVAKEYLDERYGGVRRPFQPDRSSDPGLQERLREDLREARTAVEAERRALEQQGLREPGTRERGGFEARDTRAGRQSVPPTAKSAAGYEGTVAVARTDIPALAGERFSGGSPRALGSYDPAHEIRPPENVVVPQAHGHAEQDLGQQLDARLTALTPAEREAARGRTVSIRVDQEVCSICAAALGGGPRAGVLARLSARHPDLVFEVTADDTSAVYRIVGGRRVR